MHKLLRAFAPSCVVLACLTLASGTCSAANYNIDWLNMPPTPFGSSVPNNSVFFMPGVGNVLVTYNIPAVITNTRVQAACLASGSVISGSDTYAWTNHEYFGTIFTVGPDPLVPVVWTITYTFPGVQPPGTIFVGADGLGATTSFGGGASIVTVNQNGAFLGDWGTPGCGNLGPTQFTGGPGTFSMQNSVTAPGGLDPNWNTPLGVVKINDPVSSITISVSQIRGDGIGVNIGNLSQITPTNKSTWGHLRALYR